MKQSIKERIKTAPEEPGVYIFYKNHSPLYVGKAANLRNRLKSYLKITDIKTKELNEQTDRLEWMVLRSEIEALIEESRLIKELKPKYNVLWKDDKSYLYVALTRQSIPKIFITHKNSRLINLSSTHQPETELIGPFTDGAALRLAMKIIRRYFPYCTCFQSHLRDCLNAQIGLCLGVCCKKGVFPREHTISEYRHNIKMIKAVLRGQSKKLLKTLKKPVERLALEKIFEHRSFIVAEGIASRKQRPLAPAASGASLSAIYRSNNRYNERIQTINRVECYDNSNFAGKEAVGAMTALKKIENRDQKIEFLPDKGSYRKFEIKSVPTRDDPRMIAEILKRRLNHPEWPYPDLIIIDGGLTQYRAAKAILKSSKFNPPAGGQNSKIKVLSFAKPQKQVYGLKPNDQPTPISELSEELQKLIERAIYQTHNFVIRYHRQLRRKGFLL